MIKLKYNSIPESDRIINEVFSQFHQNNIPGERLLTVYPKALSNTFRLTAIEWDFDFDLALETYSKPVDSYTFRDSGKYKSTISIPKSYCGNGIFTKYLDQPILSDFVIRFKGMNIYQNDYAVEFTQNIRIYDKYESDVGLDNSTYIDVNHGASFVYDRTITN